MNPSLSLDEKWWLQFQPEFQGKINFGCDSLYNRKLSVTEEDLHSNNNQYAALQFTQQGFGNNEMYSQLPTCTDSDLSNCSNGQTCGQSKNDTCCPREVNEENSAFNKVKKVNGSKDHATSAVDGCQDQAWTMDKLMDGTGLEGSINHYLNCTNAKSYEKGGIRWRRADQRELASIVAVKSAEHLQNCDLPPPQSVWHGSAPFKSSDKFKEMDMSKSKDADFSTSVGRFKSPYQEEKGLNSLLLYGHSPSTSEATESQVAHKSSSADYRERIIRYNGRITSSGGETEYLEADYTRKSDLLDALRHSQTRAREAEKTAAIAVSEKEKLLSLFLREASHLFAYQQWLRLLEIENIKLRLQVKVLQSEGRDYLNSDSCEMSRNKKMVKKDRLLSMPRQDRHYRKRNKSDSGMSITWGLAVTLGLSLASAGLILGWSMGWILPNL